MASTEISSPSRKTYITRLKALCNASGVLPTSLLLPGDIGDLGTRPVNSNSSANVYKATYQGRAVAVKVLKARRMKMPDNMHKVRARRFTLSASYTHLISQRLVKEVVGWAWLRHENILPFIGIATQPNKFSMVSEWIPNGDVMSFISHGPNRNPFPFVSWPLKITSEFNTAYSSSTRWLGYNTCIGTILFTGT